MTPTLTTPARALGLTLPGVTAAAQHIANLLEKDGPAAAHLARTLLAGVASLTSKDLTGVLAALSAAQPDVTQIIADIKAEFGLAS